MRLAPVASGMSRHRRSIEYSFDRWQSPTLGFAEDREQGVHSRQTQHVLWEEGQVDTDEQRPEVDLAGSLVVRRAAETRPVGAGIRLLRRRKP